MVEILFEDYGNLNRIESSLLFFNDRKEREGKMELKDMPITPNSKIVVDKITPHTFTNAFEMLEDDDSIGAMVFRAQGRQLCLVTKYDIYKGKNWNQNYFVKLSDFAIYSLGMMSYYSSNGYAKFEKATQAKTAVSRCLKSYFENAPEGTRKKWDALIIYKDPTVQQTRYERSNAQQGSVPTPRDKNAYKEYVEKLKTQFAERCRKYLDDVRPNTNNPKEIAEFLMQRANISKLKFKGINYILTDNDVRNVGRPFETYYRKNEDNSDNETYPQTIRIRFEWKGYIPYIKDIDWTHERWAGRGSDWRRFEELDKITNS